MKNIISIMKKYRVPSGFGYSIVKFKYKGVNIEIPLFPVANCISELNKRLPDILATKKEVIADKKTSNKINKELNCIVEFKQRHPVNPAKQHIVVRSYFYKGIKQDYVSCYPAQNKGNIKNVYGDINELYNDLKAIA